jgi:hypothetical protein
MTTPRGAQHHVPQPKGRAALFVVAYEPPPDDRSPQARQLRVAVEAARQSDLRVVPLPWPFPEPEGVLPDHLPGDLAVYCGPIPQRPEHYASLERALVGRGARLVNTAAASEQATRIELWHDRLGELTARTVVVRGPADLSAAAELGFPLFIKGLVKSAKELGLEACLARDADALDARARGAWRREQTVVAREYLPLRYAGETMMEFPHGREYRFVLLDRAVLASAFYWDGTDPFAGEDTPPQSLALSAAECLDARLLAVDIGQLDDRSWRVIEVGDAQHTALGHIAPHLYWTTLRERLA